MIIVTKTSDQTRSRFVCVCVGGADAGRGGCTVVSCNVFHVPRAVYTLIKLGCLQRFRVLKRFWHTTHTYTVKYTVKYTETECSLAVSLARLWWMGGFDRLDSDARELKDTLARIARHALEREAGTPGNVRAPLIFRSTFTSYMAQFSWTALWLLPSVGTASVKSNYHWNWSCHG